MEITCSFKQKGVCASDKRYDGEVVVPLSSCRREGLENTHSVGINGVHSETELIFRVGQGFCVFGIQGRFKSGIRYIAA